MNNDRWSLKREYFENRNEKRAFNDGIYDSESYTYTHKKWGKVEFTRCYGGDFSFDNLIGRFTNNNEPWYTIIMPDGERFDTQDFMFIFKSDFLKEVTDEYGFSKYVCKEEDV